MIDGVAFGRPFLKRADRPAVRIPPRKRKRVTYSGEDDSITGSDNSDRQIAIRARFENTDEESNEDESEDDEDFDPEAEDEDDIDGGARDDKGLEDEIEGLQNDLQFDEVEAHDSKREYRTRSRRRSSGLGLDFGDGTYHNPLLEQYSQDEPLIGPPALKVSSRISKDKSKVSNPRSQRSRLKPQYVNRRGSAGSIKSVHFEDGEAMTPATIIEAKGENDGDEENDDEGDDEDFDPARRDGSTDLDESDKENTEPAEDMSDPSNKSDSSSSSYSGLVQSEDELEDATSSSGTSSSDADLDSDPTPNQLSRKVPNEGKEDEKSPGSSSTSCSDPTLGHGKKDKTEIQHVTPNTAFGDIPAEVSKKTPASNPPVPPGGGKQSTRMRNLRRKASAALKFHKAKGDLRDDATIEDLIRLKEQNSSSIPPWMMEMRSKLHSNLSNRSNSKRTGFEKERKDAADLAAKRDLLLQSLRSQGGIDVSSQDKQADEKPAHTPENTVNVQVKNPPGYERQTNVDDVFVHRQLADIGSKSNSVQRPYTVPEDAHPTSVRAAEIHPAEIPLPSSPPPDASIDPASVPPGSQKRRSKLDLAGSKRLLFGSLGLKAPKTKDDELALREKLMKDVRPLKPVKDRVAEIEAAEAGAPLAEGNEDSWKDKIELAAVECCHDGIVLSTPPFPFVQRWDPQQQGTYGKKKGKKGKKRKRVDQSYYEENHDRGAIRELPSKIARHESYDPNVERPQFDAVALEQDRTLGTQEWSNNQSVHDSAAANEQLLRETGQRAACEHPESEEAPKAEDTPDLPCLPDDLTKCQRLEKRHCFAGAIIAFKKFLMSAETNWQPGISGYLTALVDDLKEDGTVVVTLANRDLPKSAARYHEETGERLYSKFEMPGFDEDDASNGSQRLEMPFDELISPLLIRPAPSHSIPIAEGEATVSSRPDDTLAEDEAQRPTTETQAPLSFDSNLENSACIETEMAVPTESARQKIVEMIQDAGWRSSLGSSVGRALEVNGHAVTSQGDGYDEEAHVLTSPASWEIEASAQVNGVQSASSPLPAVFQASKNPQTPVIKGGDSEHSEEENSSRLSAPKAVVQYPNLPQNDDEGELFQSQRQHRSVSMDNNLQATPQDLISPPPIHQNGSKTKLSATPASHSQELEKGVAGPRSTLDGAEDSDEFPELFSQAFEVRIAQDPTIKDKSSQKYDMRKLPKKKSKLGSTREKNFDQPELSGSDLVDAENVSSFLLPSQSQVTQSSQIVDLTSSGGPLGSMADEDEGVSSYKSSSGWVDKPEANKDIGVAKRSSRRKTRYSSAMA